MSKIPEEVMGNEQNELGAKKPDFAGGGGVIIA